MRIIETSNLWDKHEKYKKKKQLWDKLWEIKESNYIKIFNYVITFYIFKL